jgi:hypothetical protein
MSSALTYRAGIPDAELLRALADEIPNCAPAVRKQLKDIANFMDSGTIAGSIRCHSCGAAATVWLRRGV